MASINKLSPGQILYELRTQRMGNTTMRIRACFAVRVVSIAEDYSHIMASWNGNPARPYYPRGVAKLRVKKPEPKREIFGMKSY